MTLDEAYTLADGLGLTHEQLYGASKGVVDDRYGCTPRHIMQTLGTEWGRELIHPDVWVRAMGRRIFSQPVVVADVRFPNEAMLVRNLGVLIHVEGRGGIDGDHESEQLLDRLEGDLVVRNDGSIEQLHAHLETVFTCSGSDPCKVEN